MVLRSFSRNPEPGAVCSRVSQHWRELPSSQEEPNNESVTVTLSLSPGALRSTILWWITQFTKKKKKILQLNPVQSFFMWNANFVRLSLGRNPPLWTPRAKLFHTLHNYSNNTWCSLCNILLDERLVQYLILKEALDVQHVLSLLSGFQASNSLYSSLFCPRCVTGIFWNKHTRFHRPTVWLFVPEYSQC